MGLRLVSGRWPRSAGEVAIDRFTASGDHVAHRRRHRRLDEPSHQALPVAGSCSSPTSATSGATIAVFDPKTAQAILDRPRAGRHDPRARRGRRLCGRARASRAGGAPELIRRVAVDRPRPRRAHDARASSASSTSSCYILLAFGGVALLVGSFIIYNTFAITVAQRVRELALLRCLGAHPAPGARLGARRGPRHRRRRLADRHGFGVALGAGLIALFNAMGLTIPAVPIALTRGDTRPEPDRRHRRHAGRGAHPG